MSVEEIKQKLYKVIEASNDKTLLEDLLAEAESGHREYLSDDDYTELVSLVKEPPLKDTLSYQELKSSLSKWFTK